MKKLLYKPTPNEIITYVNYLLNEKGEIIPEQDQEECDESIESIIKWIHGGYKIKTECELHARGLNLYRYNISQASGVGTNGALLKRVRVTTDSGAGAIVFDSGPAARGPDDIYERKGNWSRKIRSLYEDVLIYNEL